MTYRLDPGFWSPGLICRSVIFYNPVAGSATISQLTVRIPFKPKNSEVNTFKTAFFRFHIRRGFSLYFKGLRVLASEKRTQNRPKMAFLTPVYPSRNFCIWNLFLSRGKSLIYQGILNFFKIILRRILFLPIQSSRENALDFLCRFAIITATNSKICVVVPYL